MATGKELLQRVTSIKSDNPDITAARNKATLNGGLIGMAGGFYFGYAKKKNILVCGLIGGIGGVIIARLFVPK